MLFGLGVSLYTSRVTLHILGTEDFGLFNLIGGVLALFTFLNGTLYQATSRFITFELGKTNVESVRRVFTNSFSLHVITAAIVLLLGETIGLYFVNYILEIPENRLFACNILYQTVIISTCLSIGFMTNGALIIAHEKMSFFAITGLISVLAKLAIAIIIQFINWDQLIWLGILNLIVSVAIITWQCIYCFRTFPGEFSFNLKIERTLSKDMMHFSFWQLIGSLAFMLRMQGVSILMNLFFGAIANAANAIAYQVNGAVSGFVSNFTTAVNPQITKDYASGEYSTMRLLIYRAGKLSFYLLSILCGPIILNTDFVLTLWLGKDFPNYTIIMTQLVLIISIVESFTYSIGCAINATGKVKGYQLVICGIMLSIFPFTWLLFKLGFPPYAGLQVYLFTSIVALLSRLYFMKRDLGIVPGIYIRRVFLKTIPITIIATLIPYLSFQLYDSSFLWFFIKSAIFEMLLFGGIWTFGLEPNEKNWITRIFKMKILKKSI